MRPIGSTLYLFLFSLRPLTNRAVLRESIEAIGSSGSLRFLVGLSKSSREPRFLLRPVRFGNVTRTTTLPVLTLPDQTGLVVGSSGRTKRHALGSDSEGSTS